MNVLGMGNMPLVCRADHEVARLIKPAAHQPAYISVPREARVEWPRQYDMKRTTVYCQECEAWFSADSFDLARSFQVVVRDEWPGYRLRPGPDMTGVSPCGPGRSGSPQ